MELINFFVIILGLMIFEVSSSVDNIIFNAEVLKGIPKAFRRWFLTYGMFVSVFLVRGFLPLLIIYFANPGIGFVNAFLGALNSNSSITAGINDNSTILFAGGGTYLFLLFLYWFFSEPKNSYFHILGHLHRKRGHNFLFYLFAFLSLILILLVTANQGTKVLISVMVGAFVFLIGNYLKKSSERIEVLGEHRHMGIIKKLLYLEILDAAFSVDGVLGAFAFTITVPLIMMGSGLGALIIRYATVKSIKVVRLYKYLKNGAMYSIAALGMIMLSKSVGVILPSWLPTLSSVLIIGFFLFLSNKELQDHKFKLQA